MKRIQADYIIKDLKKKMVFLAGPRQVGKTYLAKQIAKKTYKNPIYLNYDHLEHREIIQSIGWLETTDLLILDELHKMPEWKNYLKGIYDTKSSRLHILVTGSARLEIFDKIGDSLAGRYFLHKLLPLSLAELKRLGKTERLNFLIERSGFPEPYLSKNILEANRWRQQYIQSLLATDIFEFDKVDNIKALHTIFELLRIHVGSPVSYQSIAEDVQVSPHTVKKYIGILEALYIVFRITPFSKNIARSLLKEPKIYFFDHALVKSGEGAKLENLVAVSLLKHIFAKNDYYAENNILHYLRTKEGQEVDFALVKDGVIHKIIEVKSAASDISPSLFYFNQKYHLPAVQVVQHLRNERMVKNIKLMKIENFLASLFL